MNIDALRASRQSDGARLGSEIDHVGHPGRHEPSERRRRPMAPRPTTRSAVTGSQSSRSGRAAAASDGSSRPARRTVSTIPNVRMHPHVFRTKIAPDDSFSGGNRVGLVTARPGDERPRRTHRQTPELRIAPRAARSPWNRSPRTTTTNTGRFKPRELRRLARLQRLPMGGGDGSANRIGKAACGVVQVARLVDEQRPTGERGKLGDVGRQSLTGRSGSLNEDRIDRLASRPPIISVERTVRRQSLDRTGRGRRPAAEDVG